MASRIFNLVSKGQVIIMAATYISTMQLLVLISNTFPPN